jgi:elongation factor G
MKVYKTDQIRNITLIGNAGSGKTTLAEAMLFEGGVINRRGEVTAKNTVSDYSQIEQDYGNSVYPSLMYTEYNGKKINIIDAPGMDDLCGGVVSALYVTELGLLTINSTNGVESGTEAAYRHADTAHTPLVLVFNQLDHDNSNFEAAFEKCKNTFGNKVTIIQYPVDAGPNFTSIIDVLKMKMYKYGKDGGKPEILDIPASEMDKAEELHNQLSEMAAENEEALMELFFEKGSLTEDEMRKGIKLGMIDRSLYPVFCTCAKKNIGVGRLLEFISNIAPAPNEKKPIPVVSGQTPKMEESDKPSLFVFRTSVEQHVGEITYFKVMSGKVKEGMDLTNTKSGNKERLSQVFASAGKTVKKPMNLWLAIWDALLNSGKQNTTIRLQPKKPQRFTNPLNFQHLDILLQ